MKNLNYILLGLIIVLTGDLIPINAQQSFYIYRNDGLINPFFTNEIDSITFSRYDINMEFQPDYSTQEIHTRDSVYRIPLEVIDSVGFVTPKTVYKSNVRVLEGDIRKHIKSRNDFILQFFNETPDNILPKKGEKLVSTKADDVLENAFIGQVVEINKTSDGIDVICEPVDLTNVFECYYGITQTEQSIGEDIDTRAEGIFANSGFKTLEPGKFSQDLFNLPVEVEYEANNDIAFGVKKLQNTVSITPKIKYNAYLIVDPVYGTNIGVTAISNFTLEQYFAFSGNLNGKGEKALFEKAIPIPEALVDIFFETGPFFELNCEVATEQTLTQEYQHVFHWEWSSEGKETVKSTNDFKPVSINHNGKIAIDGSVAVGAYLKIGVAFIATSSLDIAQIDLCAKGGLSLEGDFIPYKNDAEYAKTSTDLYNQIKDGGVGLYGYYGLSAEAKLFKWSVSKEIPNFFNFPLNRKGQLIGFKNVPNFSNTSLALNGNGGYKANVDISGNSVPCDIGFALINKNDKNDAYYKYTLNEYSGPSAQTDGILYADSNSEDYEVYPLVKYMDLELIANPSAQAGIPLKIEYFEQKSQEWVDGMVKASLSFKLTKPTDSNVNLEDFLYYGLYATFNNTGEEYYFSANANGNMEFDINASLLRDSFSMDCDNFSASSRVITIGTFTTDQEGNTKIYDLQECEIIYDVKPSIRFTDAYTTSNYVTGYDEENEITYFHTDYVFNCDIRGSFWFDYIQFIVSSNWTNNWSPQYIYSDGICQMDGWLDYSSNWSVNHTGNYQIIFTNGSFGASSNSLIFSGSPGNVYVSVGGFANSNISPLSNNENNTGNKSGVSHFKMMAPVNMEGTKAPCKSSKDHLEIFERK